MKSWQRKKNIPRKTVIQSTSEKDYYGATESYGAKSEHETQVITGNFKLCLHVRQ